MQIDPEQITVRDNSAESRFETEVAGHLAFAAYRREGTSITFTHTEVPAELGGHGVAHKLIQTALDDARTRGLRIVPLCPFVRSYIQEHRSYQDLVDPKYLEP